MSGLQQIFGWWWVVTELAQRPSQPMNVVENVGYILWDFSDVLWPQETLSHIFNWDYWSLRLSLQALMFEQFDLFWWQRLGSLVVWIGLAPNKLMCLSTWPVRRCGLVGKKSVSRWGVSLRSPLLKLWPVWNLVSLLPVHEEVDILAPPAPWLHGCCYVSHHDNGLNLTLSQPHVDVFCYKSCNGNGVSSQQWNPS